MKMTYLKINIEEKIDGVIFEIYSGDVRLMPNAEILNEIIAEDNDYLSDMSLEINTSDLTSDDDDAILSYGGNAFDSDIEMFWNSDSSDDDS